MSISFEPLWNTMVKKGFTTYDLKVKDCIIGGGTYNRLKNNLPVSTHTIGLLCEYLDCDVSVILTWKKIDTK